MVYTTPTGYGIVVIPSKVTLIRKLHDVRNHVLQEDSGKLLGQCAYAAQVTVRIALARACYYCKARCLRATDKTTVAGK